MSFVNRIFRRIPPGMQEVPIDNLVPGRDYYIQTRYTTQAVPVVGSRMMMRAVRERALGASGKAVGRNFLHIKAPAEGLWKERVRLERIIEGYQQAHAHAAARGYRNINEFLRREARNGGQAGVAAAKYELERMLTGEWRRAVFQNITPVPGATLPIGFTNHPFTAADYMFFEKKHGPEFYKNYIASKVMGANQPRERHYPGVEKNIASFLGGGRKSKRRQRRRKTRRRKKTRRRRRRKMKKVSKMTKKMLLKQINIFMNSDNVHQLSRSQMNNIIILLLKNIKYLKLEKNEEAKQFLDYIIDLGADQGNKEINNLYNELAAAYFK